MAENILPAGLLGTYYAARNAYGHYRSCAIASRLACSFPEETFVKCLRQALRKTIQRHPSLNFGVADKREYAEAVFIRLPQISWEDAVEIPPTSTISESRLDSDKEKDVALSKCLEKAHQFRWKDQLTKPAWKLIVVKHEGMGDGEWTVDIIFVNQHAIADGLSGTAFQRTLLRFLYEALTTEDAEASEWPVLIPADIKPPTGVEECVPLSREVTSAPEVSSFDPWTFSPMSMDSIDEVITSSTFITITPSELSLSAQFRSSLSISQTGYLHALTIIFLSRAISKAQGFRSGTPYSLRRFSGLGPDEMANHIAYIESDWSAELVNDIRASQEKDNKDQNFIVAINQQFRKELKAETAKVPITGPTMLGTIARIQNLEKYCQDAMKSKRGFTYELSNLGGIEVPATSSGKLHLEKMVFTQCAMITGPAFGVNVVIVKDGPMVIGLTWQKGIVEDKLMEDLGAFLKFRFASGY